VDGKVTALLRDHAGELRRADVDGLTVYTPKRAGTFEDEAGSLTVVH